VRKQIARLKSAKPEVTGYIWWHPNMKPDNSQPPDLSSLADFK
jgi:hypothetical protein